MARSKRPTTAEREDPLLASFAAPPDPWPSVVTETLNTNTPLDLYEDGRLFHPEKPFGPALDIGGRPGRLVAGSKNKNKFPSHQVQFEAPGRVIHCVRRKRRREVIFAKRKHRKGAGARRHRRTWWSNIRC